MQQPVHFARASDGITIAYGAGGGGGRPILLVPGWISHVELDMENPGFEDPVRLYEVKWRS